MRIGWSSNGSCAKIGEGRSHRATSRCLVQHDEAFRNWYATLMRQGASPRAILLLGEMSKAVDVRSLLPRVAVPTLVMHRSGDRVVEVESGRYLAEHIPDARWVELAGEDFILWAGDLDTIADEMEEFLTGRRIGSEATRVVVTVMFTDVVGSTARAEALGDRAWSDLLPRMTRDCARSFTASEATRSTPPVTGSSRPSPLLPPRSAAHKPYRPPFARSGSRSGSVFTPANARSPARSCGGSRSTSVRGWRGRRMRAKWSSRRP